MKISYFVCFLALILGGNSQSTGAPGDVTEVETVTSTTTADLSTSTTTTPSTTTTLSTTTATTTSSSATTATTTSSSTAAPTTTTPANSDSNTTTAATTTTTTTGPPPTVDPSNPNEQKGDWTIMDDNNRTCIKLKAEIRLEIQYNKTNQEKFQTSFFDVPSTAVASGNCNLTNVTQELTLTFFDDWKLSMTFQKLKDSYNLTKISIEFVADNDTFPNITIAPGSSETVTSIKMESDSEYHVDLAKAFRCDSESTVGDFKTDGSMQAKVYSMKTWKVEMQAFLNATNADFGKFSPCEADNTNVNNIVPIVVGAALAGLVLIVLIAYLIGRSRNKRGYQSV